MDIVLRLETSADYAETEKVVREAFWNVYAPGCTEHYLVHVMRSSENFVRELAFVAVADSKIVGCVMFVKGTIAGDDGVVREVLTLGPIAVLPAYQKKGLGRRLNLISNFRRKIASRTRRHKNDCWKLLQCSDRLTAQNAREPAWLGFCAHCKN